MSLSKERETRKMELETWQLLLCEIDRLMGEDRKIDHSRLLRRTWSKWNADELYRGVKELKRLKILLGGYDRWKVVYTFHPEFELYLEEAKQQMEENGEDSRSLPFWQANVADVYLTTNEEGGENAGIEGV